MPPVRKDNPKRQQQPQKAQLDVSPHELTDEERAVAFASLAENSNDLVALLDLDGRLLFLNDAGRKLVGLESGDDLSLRNLADFLPASVASRLRDVDFPALRAAGRWNGEAQLLNCRTGRLIDVWVNSFLVEHGASAPPLCIATVQRDVTDRKRDEQSIRASEERFRQLAENIEEVFWVSEVDPRKILYVSPALSTVFGIPPEALYENADAFLGAIHPQDRGRVLASLPRARDGGYDETYRVVRPDGSIRTVRSRAFPVRDGQGVVYRVAGIAQDITATKHFEEELLAERRFLEHLLSVQEGERKLIAYDIHDGFLQAVIAAKMHLEALGADPTVGESTRAKLQSPVGLLHNSIEEARRMISGLRPPILDEQGLVAAIDFLVSEQRNLDTKIEFHHSVHFDRFEGVLEGTLFRIVQEALSNVLRHSQSDRVEISLTQTGDTLRLVVEDWGIGFDVDKITGRRFGLRGIRERARLFGGKATIDSSPGAGTRVSVELPCLPDFTQATVTPLA